MRIGLYGLPTAGKTFLLDQIKCMDVLSGSSLLKKLSPDFQSLPADKKREVREQLAISLRQRDHFIMDGHYSFGDDVVFTEADGELYDVILYLYVDASVLKERMEASERNRKYLKFDIESWQMCEIAALRQYCHEHDKDFYVIDSPEEKELDISVARRFIYLVASNHYSCVSFARKCADKIADPFTLMLEMRRCRYSNHIRLADGDRTTIIEDSCGYLGYETHIFDGNFYTGYQFWKHHLAFESFLLEQNGKIPSVDELCQKLHKNTKIHCFTILTSGYEDFWKKFANLRQHTEVYCGPEMSADTKYFITKFLQRKGFVVTAYGDSMNDYYMIKQADTGNIVLREDHSVSSSLKNQDLGGLNYV